MGFNSAFKGLNPHMLLVSVHCTDLLNPHMLLASVHCTDLLNPHMLLASVHSGDVNLHDQNLSVSCSSCIVKTRFTEGSKLYYEQVTAENIITTNLLNPTGYVMHQQA